MKADLHLHSTASDGVMQPLALAEICAEQGITLISVTDHDTMAGSDQLRGCSLPVRVIPGVELSMRDMPSLHLLAYGLTDAPALRAKIGELALHRQDRSRLILDRLAGLGMPLSWNELRRRASGSIGRPHIARAMVHAGYVKNMQEAFERYIGHDGPAYVSSERLCIREAIPLLRKNGYVPVLAHPRELKLADHLLVPLLEEWKELGLLGLEVYHPSALAGGCQPLDAIARRMGLLVTGGSDFHQPNDRHGQPGSCCEAWTRCTEDCEALLSVLEKEAEI